MVTVLHISKLGGYSFCGGVHSTGIGTYDSNTYSDVAPADAVITIKSAVDVCAGRVSVRPEISLCAPRSVFSLRIHHRQCPPQALHWILAGTKCRGWPYHQTAGLCASHHLQFSCFTLFRPQPDLTRHIGAYCQMLLRLLKH